jgi:threonine dehydratase
MTPHSMPMISEAHIEKAYRNIQKDIVCTPLVVSQKLSRLCGCRVLLKLENFQLTGSFKERGALNKLLSLSLLLPIRFTEAVKGIP